MLYPTGFHHLSNLANSTDQIMLKDLLLQHENSKQNTDHKWLLSNDNANYIRDELLDELPIIV